MLFYIFPSLIGYNACWRRSTLRLYCRKACFEENLSGNLYRIPLIQQDRGRMRDAVGLAHGTVGTFIIQRSESLV